MVGLVEDNILKQKQITLENVRSIVSSVDAKSSRKYVRKSATELFQKIEQYSSFFQNECFYLSLQELINTFYAKIEVQYYLPRLYTLSLLTSTEAQLRDEILTTIDKKQLDWLEDRVNVDVVCKLFANESNVFLDKLYVQQSTSEIVFAIAFRLCDTERQFLKYCEVNESTITDQIYGVICEEINRNPCRHEFLKQTKYYSDFIDYLGVKSDSFAIKAKILMHYYSEIDDESIANQLSADLCKSILEMSSKEHRLLFLMIRRLPNKRVTTEFKEQLLVELSRKSEVPTKLLMFKFLAGTLSLKERAQVHLNFILKTESTNKQLLATAASVLELPQTSLSLLRGLISNDSVRNWIPKGSFDSVKEIFSCANNIFPKITNVSNNLPLVSVIITTYNPDIELIKLAIESILNQHEVQVQIIVVDDCSSLELQLELKRLIDSLMLSNDEILLIKQKKNVGQYACRNVAIEYAKGAYICIQDDDDISHPDRLQTQVKTLENQTGSMLCYTKHLRIKENIAPCIDDRRSLEIFGDGPATLLLKSSVIEDIGGFRTFRSRGDIEFRERAKSYYGKGAIAYIEEPMYMMRSSLKSVSSIYEYLYSDRLGYYRDIIDVNAKSKSVMLPSENAHG